LPPLAGISCSFHVTYSKTLASHLRGWSFQIIFIWILKDQVTPRMPTQRRTITYPFEIITSSPTLANFKQNNNRKQAYLQLRPRYCPGSHKCRLSDSLLTAGSYQKNVLMLLLDCPPEENDVNQTYNCIMLDIDSESNTSACEPNKHS
jgi:hypothetical protein